MSPPRLASPRSCCQVTESLSLYHTGTGAGAETETRVEAGTLSSESALLSQAGGQQDTPPAVTADAITSGFSELPAGLEDTETLDGGSEETLSCAAASVTCEGGA